MNFTNQTTTNARASLRMITLVAGLAAMVVLSSTVSANVITLTGGDPADGNGPGGYVSLGTTVYAYNVGTSTDLTYTAAQSTVQGVRFLGWQYPSSSPPASPANPAGIPNTSITMSGGSSFSSPGAIFGSPTANDTAMNNLLLAGAFSSGSGITLTLGGLTVGQPYQVDIMVSTNGDTRIENFTFTGATVATDFFTAGPITGYDVREILAPNAGGNIVVTLPNPTDVQNPNNPFLNAFSVTVPEPASLSCLLAGGLLLLRRRGIGRGDRAVAHVTTGSLSQEINMNRTLKLLFVMVVVGLISMMSTSAVRAAKITFDNSNGGGYVPATPYYAYNVGTSAGGADDVSATMQGITFLPWNYPAASPPSSPANPAGVSSSLITVSGNGAFANVPALALGGTDSAALRELLRGGFYSNGLTLTLGGLIPNQRFQVDLFVQTNGDSRVENFTFTGATAPTDSFTADASHAYDVRETLLPNGTGNIVVTLPNTGDNPFLNAFSVTAVPEPTTAAVLGISSLLAFVRRRGR